MRKIGLFGGSFDPVHNGHIKLANLAVDQLQLDELWFIVAYDQPLKDSHFESFENRVHLLEVALKDYEHLKVVTVEKDLPKPSYTYNTISHLNEVHKQSNFVWIMGSDNLESLHKWYRIDDLKEMIDFVVVTRDGDDVLDYESIQFNDEASSTKVRAGQFKFITSEIASEIFKNHMYKEVILYNNLSERRANHVMRCVDVALEIAQYHDFDLKQVYEAVYLHDITKELDKQEERKLMEQYFSEYLTVHHKVYHQFTGSLIAKEQYLIEDDDVLTAIRHHTTGDDERPLSKLVYVADKVERGRPYEVEQYIKLAKENLDEAFIKVKYDAEMHRKEGK